MLCTEEPKVDEEEVECTVSYGPHMTSYFASEYWQKKGAEGFIVYGLEG